MSKFKVTLLLLTTLILHFFLLASAAEIPKEIPKDVQNKIPDGLPNKIPNQQQLEKVKEQAIKQAENEIKARAHDKLKEFWDEWGTTVIVSISVFMFIIICNFCWVIGTCIWCCCRKKTGVAVPIPGTFATPTEYFGGPTATPSPIRQIIYNHQKPDKPESQDANNPALEPSPV